MRRKPRVRVSEIQGCKYENETKEQPFYTRGEIGEIWLTVHTQNLMLSAHNEKLFNPTKKLYFICPIHFFVFFLNI